MSYIPSDLQYTPMTRVIKNLKKMFNRGGQPQAHFECRDCGTTVDTPSSVCPNCGSQEIGRYDV